MVPRGSARTPIWPAGIRRPAWARINVAPSTIQAAAIENSRCSAGFAECRRARPTRRAGTTRSYVGRYRRAGSDQRNLVDPERQHVQEAARWIDAMRLGGIPRQRGRAGPQSRRRKGLHRKIQDEKCQRSDRQQPARTKQERQDDEPCERILGENIAVPDQVKVDEPEHQQHGEPAHQQHRAPFAFSPAARTGWPGLRRTTAKTARAPSDRRTASGSFRRRCRSAIDRGLGKRNRSKIETRNSVTTFIATTPSRAMPRNTSMASIRSADACRPGRCDAIGH